MTFKSKWKLNDVCSNVKWSATILFISCWMHLTRTPTEISYSYSSSYSILFLFFFSFTQWINSFIFIGVILYSNVLGTEMKAWKLQNIVNWFNSIWCQIVINSADWGTFSITSFSICICCCIALHYICHCICSLFVRSIGCHCNSWEKDIWVSLPIKIYFFFHFYFYFYFYFYFCSFNFYSFNFC